MLATQRRPSSGDATLFGHSAYGDPYRARQMIGLAPQEVSLYPALTAAENLQFFGSIYGVRQSEMRERIDELLALVGLDAHRNDQVGIFSGGMKRRLNLAVSLVHRPKLILLDEPTAGVDPQSREQILKIMSGLRDNGTAILYTTHYMEEAAKLCRRVGIIDNGRLIAEGTPADLITAHGGLDRVRLTCDGPGVDELADECRQLAGVGEVRRWDGGLELSTDHGAAVLPELVALASRHAVQLMGVEVLAPDLEGVFLALTGKELRD
jgi:ABC-2 type transport system ATP-binding protein